MSRIRGKEVPYRCFHDCRQEGCPGHTIRVDYYNTVDLVEVHVDGEERAEWLFDPMEFEAILKSWESLT